MPTQRQVPGGTIAARARFTDTVGWRNVGAAMTYHYRHYNQYDQLRPHWGFWLTMLFSVRHIAGFILVSMSGRGGGRVGVGREAIDLGGVLSLIEPIYMIADIPALVLLYALGSRLPKSGAAVRWVWGAGRPLIIASVAVYLALVALTRGADVAAFGPATWASLALNALVVAYVLGSKYMKELFGQFPAADASPGS